MDDNDRDGHNPAPRSSPLMAISAEVGKAVLTVTLGAVVALLITPWVQDRLTDPTCDDPRELHLVTRDELSAAATSTNPAESGATYEAALAIDGDSSTGWVEGVGETSSNKYGEGETLTITLDRPRDVQLVCVINGYAFTPQSFLRNARVRQLVVTTDTGSRDSVLPDKPLESYAGYQSVDLRRGATASLQLTIGTASAGQDPAQETDTAISEVEIWSRDE